MKLTSTYRINWKRRLGPVEIWFSWRRRDGIMGRFGGGWNWKLGVQVGGKSVLISLLVAELSISRRTEA